MNHLGSTALVLSLVTACQAVVDDDATLREQSSAIVNGTSAAAYPFTNRLAGDLLDVVDFETCTGTVVSVCPQALPTIQGDGAGAATGTGGSTGTGAAAGTGGAGASGGSGGGAGGTGGASSGGASSGGASTGGASTGGGGSVPPLLPPHYPVLTAGHCADSVVSRMTVQGHKLSKEKSWTHPQFTEAFAVQVSSLWHTTELEDVGQSMALARYDVGLILMKLVDPSNIPTWTQRELPGPWSPKSTARLVGYRNPGGGTAALQDVGGGNTLGADLVAPAYLQWGDSGGPWYVGSKAIASVTSIGRLRIEVAGEEVSMSTLGPRLSSTAIRTSVKQKLKAWDCETGTW